MEQQSEPARSRRSDVAALLSALVPGAGQWYAGARRRAVLVALPLLPLAAAALLVVTRSRVSLLRLAVQPAVLWAVVLVDLLLLAWRVHAVVDAARTARRPMPRLQATLVVVLAVAVAVPHLVVAGYTLRAVDLLQSVFVGDEPQPFAAGSPVSVPSTETDAAPTEEAGPPPIVGDDPLPHETVEIVPEPPERNLVFRPEVGDPEAVAAWPEIALGHRPVAPFLPLEERVDVDRITILLAGGDAGPGRLGLRTDTMIVATMDLKTGKAALFGVPRNLAYVPLPRSLEDAFVDLERRVAERESPTTTTSTTTTTTTEGTAPPPEEPVFESCKCFPEQLNALYPRTRSWTRTFPGAVDPGMEALRRTLQHVLSLRIDYYALVDMAGFVRLVEALGGVDVYVQEPLESEVSPPYEGADWAHVEVEPGMQHLDAMEALAYVRARKGSSDYTRMRRQRCMLKAVAARLEPWRVLSSFAAIADAIDGSVTTNVPLNFLPDLVEAAAALDFDDIITVGFTPPYYAPVRDAGGHPVPDVDRIRSKVRRVLAGDPGERGLGESGECGI